MMAFYLPAATEWRPRYDLHAGTFGADFGDDFDVDRVDCPHATGQSKGIQGSFGRPISLE
jgi:hypothetical protein